MGYSQLGLSEELGDIATFQVATRNHGGDHKLTQMLSPPPVCIIFVPDGPATARENGVFDKLRFFRPATRASCR
jgi:hypothetical protein